MNIRQASLRRAVSNSYYALFHLLIREAVSNWKRPDQRAELSRAFDHAPMKKASNQVSSAKFPGSPKPIVDQLKEVAKAFSELQEMRHLADYDSSKQWSRTDVLSIADKAKTAIATWRVIRNENIAQDYLLQLLVHRR